MKKTRVLIVDDSATIRALIRTHLAGDERLEVVGEASDPFDAREKIKALAPDVLTLDVEMPRMNGLEFLERLMRLRPMPVIMVSSLTEAGRSAAIEALEIGAVDCIGKPAAGRLTSAFAILGDLLVAAAGARLKGDGRSRPAPEKPKDFIWNGKYVFIGSSTGGVDALETVLGGYPAECPPTLITQHMPSGFLASFVRRLNPRLAAEFKLATDGAPLVPGTIHIAPGGETHLTVQAGSPPRCRLIRGDKRSGHRPSVDILMESAVALGPLAIGAILTGMGRDGAEGLAALRRAGGRCLAQDEASSVVFGMPRVALELGGAEAAVPLPRMAGEILALAGKSAVAKTGSGRRPA